MARFTLQQVISNVYDSVRKRLNVNSFNLDPTTGTIDQFSGTVGTTAIPLPTTASTTIKSAKVICNVDNAANKRLLVSYDGGTTFLTLSPGDSDMQDLRETTTQIQIKGNVAGVIYEVVLNREN